MALYHHDARNYEEAATKAANDARKKLEKEIEIGRGSAGMVIERVMNEVPKDQIVKAEALRFLPDDRVEVGDGDAYGVHNHALHQIAQRAEVPWAYAENLRTTKWGKELLSHSLNEIYHHKKDRFLVRSVEGEVRGFLSDKFRRLDSRPIIEAFAGACQKIGALPVQGYYLDTKIAIKALLPRVFEPSPNEVIAFGVVLQNSDYGNGALSLRAFMLRLWCTNYAITDECLRQVHLGKRLDEAAMFSQRTYDLDTKTSASALKDVIQGTLGPAEVQKMCGLIKQANDEKVDPKEIASWLKKNVLKGEAEKITEAFASADVENLPPGQSVWRLSNAISWVAGHTENKERALELMQLAGTALKRKKNNKDEE